MNAKKLIARFSLALFLLAIPFLQWSGAPQPDTAESSSRHIKLGKPQAVYERFREGYALAQDARLKIPVWVQYELRQEDLAEIVERTDDFTADPTIPAGSRAELADYQGSGFDRGHMVPSADMRKNQQVMDDCFLLSNMAPQVGVGFNRQIWMNLEALVRGWVEARGTMTIIIGPVFAVKKHKVSYKVIGDNSVAVPSHFFKIVVDANDEDNITTLAFLMPNKDLSGHELAEYLVSIDEIERLTGLDFLSALAEDQQAGIESVRAASIW